MPHYLLEAVRPCYVNSRLQDEGEQFWVECEEHKLPSAAKVVKKEKSGGKTQSDSYVPEENQDKDPDTLKELAETSQPEVTKSSKSKTKSQKGDS